MNQYGETMRLYSDLLRGKVVVIHVFFSKCSNTCPLMLATDQKLQDHLGDRLGRDVHLISLTVDPENDRWESLRDYAGRLKARSGWYFLTGSREDVGFALRSSARPSTVARSIPTSSSSATSGPASGRRSRAWRPPSRSSPSSTGSSRTSARRPIGSDGRH